MMRSLLVIRKATDKIADFLSHSNLSSLVLSLILFFSATQLGFHFWPLSTLVYGIRIDYLSPTLYFLDCLILVFLGSDLLRRRAQRVFSRTSKTSSETRSDPQSVLRLLLPIFLTNLLYSQNPLATLSWSLHFVLYLLFLRTVLTPGSDLSPERSVLKRNSRLQVEKGSVATERTDLNGILCLSLTLTLLFQTILATLQVYLGHSLGGFLYYLGERSVAVGSPGIALGSFMGHVVLRAYGTFGHPNVLAGYAVITTLIILRLVGLQLPKRANTASVRRSDLLRKSWPTAKMFSRTSKTSSETRSDLFGIYFPLTLTTLLILLTQSRSAALAIFGIIIPFSFLRSWRPRIIYFVILLSTVSYLPSTLTPPRSDLSLSERLNLQGLSLKVISQYPIFGTGAQASISTYPALPQPKPSGVGRLQPDHNSFTLFLSWFGLFGVFALGSDLLRKSWPTAKMFSRSALGGETRSDPQGVIRNLFPLLPILLLDHYLLTSPQGLFILLLYLHISKH